MNKNNTKPAYELVLITRSEKEEALKKISQLITEEGGQVSKQETWGKKRFSYPIKKVSEGYYFLWKIDLDKNKVKAFEKTLRYSDDILRYLLKTI